MELKSIAFIPDGNRRYAQKARISLLESYKLGTQKAWDVLDWLVKYPQIKVGTFYTLSLENFSRSRLELHALFKIFGRELDAIHERPIVEEQKIAFKLLGRLEQLPEKLQKKMRSVEEQTSQNKKHTVNLAIGYNGQAEIVDAAKKIAEQYKNNQLQLEKIDESAFKNYLYGNFAEPDLLIRTSGTQRLSGFLTYQSAYSELCFINKFWPELEESDLDCAIGDFSDRQRRFGK